MKPGVGGESQHLLQLCTQLTREEAGLPAERGLPPLGSCPVGIGSAATAGAVVHTGATATLSIWGQSQTRVRRCVAFFGPSFCAISDSNFSAIFLINPFTEGGTKAVRCQMLRVANLELEPWDHWLWGQCFFQSMTPRRFTVA